MHGSSRKPRSQSGAGGGLRRQRRARIRRSGDGHPELWRRRFLPLRWAGRREGSLRRPTWAALRPPDRVRIERGGARRHHGAAALLARFDANETFPRLPFEPISIARYDELMAIQEISRDPDADFLQILNKFDSSEWSIESVAGCANAACIAKAEKDELAYA